MASKKPKKSSGPSAVVTDNLCSQLSADEADLLSKIPWFIERDLLGWRPVITMDKQLNKIMDAG